MTDLKNVIWGQFKIGDLFEIEKSKSKLKKDKLLEYSPELYPVYSSDSRNHGVVGYIKENPSFKLENNNYMIVFGDHTRAINIAKESFSVCDNVKILSNSNNYSIEITLFIITAWKKAIPDLGYNRHWKTASEVNISLPTDPNGDPDYNFMEQFIKDLEQEQFQNIDNHLQATGLSDTKLTKAEQQALDDFDSLTWSDFKIGDLFSIEKTRNKLKKDKLLSFLPELYPVYSSESGNHGIVGYIKENPEYVLTSNQFMIVFGDHTRAINIAKESFSVCDNVKILSNSNKLTEKESLFIITAWKKAIPNLGYNRHWKIASDVKFKLPLDPTDPTKPDYQYMSTYIKAIEKLTIKDVVDLTDQKIQKTKQVI